MKPVNERFEKGCCRNLLVMLVLLGPGTSPLLPGAVFEYWFLLLC